MLSQGLCGLFLTPSLLLNAAACESQPEFPDAVPGCVACNLMGFTTLSRAVPKLAAVAASAVCCFLKFVD